MSDSKGYLSLYLPEDLIRRVKAAAEEDGRSLSNYLAQLLERAHPVARQVDIAEQISRAVKAGPTASARKRRSR